MARHYSRFSMIVSVALLGLNGLTACGDDDSVDDGAGGSTAQAGSGGSKAGSGGAGGKSSSAGSGGKAAGGVGGATEEGGKSGGTGGSKAGSGAAGANAGAGGAAAGSGGGPAIDYPDLSNVKGTILTDVNALSAVTYASNGTIYAAGDINTIDESKATGATEADKYKASIVGHKIAVKRFLADGKPDTTFGTGGTTIWEGPAGDATTLAIAETDDGSVVVDAVVKYESKRTGVALVKFDNTGKLVTTFGTNGRVDLTFGWTDADIADYPADDKGAARFPADTSWDLKRSPDGTKLVVFASGPAAHGQLDDTVTPAVQRIDNDRYIVRVNSSDGAIDPGFNGGAKIVVHTPNVGATGDQVKFPSDGGRHGLVESDGSIVGAGYTGYNDGKGNYIVLIRLKPDGTFDPEFHKERAGQPVLPGVAVLNPVPEADTGFAECYGVAKTPKGYVTSGYGNAFGGTTGMSSLGYLPSLAVDMVSTRFTGTDVDTTYGKSGVFAAQSEKLGDQKVSTFEDRGRASVIALSDNRTLMGGRFGQYPAVFVVTEAGAFDTQIKGKETDTDGILLFPELTSDKQPATSMVYGLALSPDGKHVAVGTNNHEQGALFTVLELKDDGTIAAQ